jgi:hypothetical protein
MITKSLRIFLVLAMIAAHASQASATELTFDGSAFPNEPAGNGDILEGIPVNDLYGDNVTSASMLGGLFQYGATGGFTPNVVVNYDTDIAAIPLTWRYDFGDLTRVIYVNPATGIMTIRFTADPGYKVQLHSFDLGGWNQSDYVINGVEVIDVTNATSLYSATNVNVLGAGPTHTDIDFNTPLGAQVLDLKIDASILGSLADNIGIDNIVFTQVAIPEPTSTIALGFGTLAFAFIARRKMQ